MKPEIPKIITHKNMQPLLDALDEEPSLQCGGPARTQEEWFDRIVTLEFPLGEFCQGWLTRIALVGRDRPEPLDLTGKEGFNAQGLEGKIQVKKSLLVALMNLSTILPPYRGRILT